MSENKLKQNESNDLKELEIAKEDILAKIAAKIGSSGEAGEGAVSAHGSHASGSKHNSQTGH